MWICNECGETCEDEDLKVTKNWSEFWGQSVCEEQTDYSCDCGGEYEEAERCPLCGDYITGDKSICDECAEDNATVETALEYGGDENKDTIELNGFLVYMFPPSVIERILTEVLQNSPNKNEQAREFCFDDKCSYTDFLRTQSEEEERERKTRLKNRRI